MKQQKPFKLISEPAPRNLVLSIKPGYASKIIEGEKTVELRRKFPLNNVRGGIAIIYSSSPVKEIIGYARIEEVEKLSIAMIWERFRKKACVTKKFFDHYFKGVGMGYVVILSTPVKLHKPLTIEELEKEYDFSAPQSFRYVTGKLLEAVEI